MIALMGRVNILVVFMLSLSCFASGREILEIGNDGKLKEMMLDMTQKIKQNAMEAALKDIDVNTFTNEIRTKVMQQVLFVKDAIEDVQASVAEKKAFLMGFAREVSEKVQNDAAQAVQAVKASVAATTQKFDIDREKLLSEMGLDGITFALETVKNNVRKSIEEAVDVEAFKEAANAAAEAARQSAAEAVSQAKSAFDASGIEAIKQKLLGGLSLNI